MKCLTILLLLSACLIGKTASSSGQSITTPTTATKETNPTITEQTRSSGQPTATPTTITKETNPTITGQTSSSSQSSTTPTTVTKETNPTITEQIKSNGQSITTPTTVTKETNPTITGQTSSSGQSTATPATVTKETNPTITGQTSSSSQSITAPTTVTKETNPIITGQTSSSGQSTATPTTVAKETNPTITGQTSSSSQSITTPTTVTKETNPTITGQTSSSSQSSTTPTTVIKETNPTITEKTYAKKIEDLNKGKNTFGKIDNMPHLPLADGSQIPVLALGTALMDPLLIPHLIGAAIDMGYRAIDTGYIYGNEKELGEGIKAKIDDGTVKREDLYIMSKLWSTFHRSDLVEVACNASLQNMGLDYFDLYMIHNPMSFKEGPDPIPKIGTVLQYSQHDYLDAWSGMEGLVTKGLAKSIGVSNFNSQQIQSILDKGGRKPVANQVECHPYLTQQRLHNFSVEHNINLNCFGVLGSKGTPAEYKNSTTAVIDDPLVRKMADGIGVTPAQLLIRYQIERGHSVVVKASTAAHLWDNLQALTFSLNQTQIRTLSALNRNKRTFVFIGMGDTHKNYPFGRTLD